MGGRAYPVRHYPIAIRLRDLAFDNKVALTVNYVNIRATCASALPTRSRSSWGPHDILRHSMYCALSSEWELFGRNTRSAFRRTPSPPKIRSLNAAHTTRSLTTYIKNGCTLFIYAGFRPRIQRNICTFGLRLLRIPPKLLPPYAAHATLRSHFL